jgi:UDPglucose 6-dehydrogenase
VLCPKVEPHQIMNDLISSTLDPAMVKRNVFIHQDAYSATKNTHALVVCTEWDEFIVSFELIIGVQVRNLCV